MNLVRLIPTAGIRRRLRGAIAAMVSAAVAAAVSIVLSAPAAAADLSDHTLGAGDLLKISVFGYPDLTQEARISQTGRISYPLIGEVGVGGMTPRGAEALIREKLSDGSFIRDPQVSVLVTEYESLKVAVLGQVNQPGKYAPLASSRLLDFLAVAGDVINDTAADTANVMRKDGRHEEIDLHALFAGDVTQNVVINGGDAIYVPKAARFYIYGEVRTPGAYRLERNLTLSRAISIGGGLTPRGSEDRVMVKRRGSGGKEQELPIEGSELLQPDDVIYVKERWF